MGKRNSGIDLLRIISILLICIAHANQTFRGISTFPIYSFTNLFTYGLFELGLFGNILFVICSSYYLVDKNKTRTEKAIQILMDSSLISILIMMGFIISGEKYDYKTIIVLVLPDIHGLNWFVPCYVVFYFLAPIIVCGLKCLTKKQHFVIVLVSLVYGLLSIFFQLYVNSSLMQFFFILILVAFIKWHLPSLYSHKILNLMVFIVGMLLCYLCYYGVFFLRIKNDYFNKYTIMSMLSPLLVVPLIGLFNIFTTFKISNRFISYLSTCTLYVYVIHENYLLRAIVRVKYFYWAFETFGENLGLLYMFVCGIFMFVAGMIIAVLYKNSLGRITSFLSNKIHLILENGTNKLFDSLFTRNQGDDQSLS